MRRLFDFTVSGAAFALASIGLASAQAPMSMPSAPAGGGPGQKTPNISQSTVYAPSDIAASASGMQQERRPRGRQGSLLSTYSATGQGLAEGQPNLPRLCFQPGVGWTTAPAASFTAMQNAGTQNDGSGDNSSDKNKSSASASLPIRHGVSALGGPRESTECPPMLLPQDATTNPGSSAANSASKFMNPSFKTDTDLSQYNSFQALLPSGPMSGTGNSAQSRPAFDLPEGFKSSRIHDPKDPTFALEELKALRRRAYVSDIKLRRLSRNPQNLETRLELRHMNTEVEKRKKAKRSAEDQDNSTDKESVKSKKHIDSMDLVARKAECEKKSDASKSKVCSLLKHGL